MNSFTACIPRTVHIDDILAEHPPKTKLKRDKLLYVIHLIRTIPMYDRRNWLNHEWVLVNADALKNVISDYKKYLNYLEHVVGLIECDRKYFPSARSMGYRFTHVRYILIESKLETLTDKTLLTALDKAWKNDHHGTDYVKKNLPYLHKWFNDKLRVDIPEDVEVPYPSIRPVKSINGGKCRLSVDKFGKRLHTPLTKLNKELRPYLRYDGQPLIEIDIKCSQPYLSLKFILDKLSKKYPDILDRLEAMKSNIDKILIIDQLEGCNGLGKYMNDVLIDDIYLVLKGAYKEKYSHDVGDGERDDYKEVIFTVMYSRNGYNPLTKVLFKELYPYPNDVLKQIKRIDHKDLSRKLQQLESKLVLRTICKEIYQHDNHIPMFTIHDSILTTPEHVVTVQKITMEVLSRCIGIAPRLHVNDLQC